MDFIKSIESIILSNAAKEEKLEQLDAIEEQVLEAKKIIEFYKFCPKCKDYYLTKSFSTKTETKIERVCTYCDPINSGGDEYDDKEITRSYIICPKGHYLDFDINMLI